MKKLHPENDHQTSSRDGAPDATLRMLRERRADIEREIKTQTAAWRSELKKVNEAIAALEAVFEPENPRPPYARKGSLASILRDATIKILAKSDRPLNRNEILDGLHAAGIDIDKDDPAKFLTRVLWRSKELVNEGDGYWLASRPRERE